MTTPVPSTPSTPQPPTDPALPPPKPKFGHGGARVARPKHKFIILRLPPSILEQFPSPPVSAPGTTGTATPKKEKDKDKDNTEDAETPRPTNTKKRPLDETNGTDTKKKTTNGVNGTGATNGAKKRKLDSSPTRSSTPQPQPPPPVPAADPLPASTRPWTQPPTAATHRLGPKANTGAINACLRALDRSGQTVSRSWKRAPFKVRSFTGFAFGCGAWEAPQIGLLKDTDAERQREKDERENVNPVGSGASLNREEKKEEKEEKVKVEGEEGEGESILDATRIDEGYVEPESEVRMSSPVVAEVGA